MDRIEPKAVALLSQPKWLALSLSTRARLVELFGLKRSASTETFTGRDSVTRVVSDGYTAEDLLGVTIEKMQKILDTDRKDFYELFDEIVANIESPTKTPEVPLRTQEIPPSGDEKIKEIINRPRGRPRRTEHEQS